jgi:hypothetical protein
LSNPNGADPHPGDLGPGRDLLRCGCALYFNPLVAELEQGFGIRRMSPCDRRRHSLHETQGVDA